MSNITATLTTHPRLLAQLDYRRELFARDPRLIYPWWKRPCRVRVLLVTDGGLDFGLGDFGFSTFVQSLAADDRFYVKFDLTLAHRDRDEDVGDSGVEVAGSIPNFRFDNSDHFSMERYDQVWLFGIDSGSGIPNSELDVLATFMNGGGGVFATGDHGMLGRNLCGSVLRVRNMRRWDNSSQEVGMSDPRRNDTNRAGNDAGSQFDDQSDDVPQTISPKLYSSRLGSYWRETYPHPLLCSPFGRITVLPDHPHEGECIEPDDLNTSYGGSPEFPGGVAPEVIAYSTVPEGNTAGSKQATQPHTFGAICAYDGHKVDVGRIVTDATWHHFTNVNLIGQQFGNPNHLSKMNGFLHSATGQQHLSQIRHYFVNIGVWLARKDQHRCFNGHFIWQLLHHHRVIEATMNNPRLSANLVQPSLLYEIGTHATDVIGKLAGQCRKIGFITYLLRPIMPDFMLNIDPWIKQEEQEPVLPWLNAEPLFGMAVGAGLLAVRDRFVAEGTNPDEINVEDVLEVFTEGAKRGVELSSRSLRRGLDLYKGLL